MTKIFHTDVYIPEEILKGYLGKNYRFEFTEHAKNACRNDRYGYIIPPTKLNLQRSQVIEIEVDATTKKVTKILVRLTYDSKRDLMVAFIPDGDVGRVKTLWYNLTSDNHRTLDRSKYQTTI